MAIGDLLWPKEIVRTKTKNAFLEKLCKPTYFDYSCGVEVAHGSIKCFKIIPFGNEEFEQ